MNDLTALLDRMRTQRPVAWDQLPDFALYMDQVLSYMDRQVLRFDEEDALTASMVNNYTKSGLVPPGRGQEVQPGASGLPDGHLRAQAGDVHPGHGSADPGGTAGRAHRGGRIHRLLRKPEQRPAGHGPGNGGPSGRRHAGRRRHSLRSHQLCRRSCQQPLCLLAAGGAAGEPAHRSKKEKERD